ncbi:MAG: DNA-3-methyladenine glycosylase 2 family protein [Chloroflexota bacterium]|nr:DNA-3-methyladenine glycosylase 2 family protein [Chloroflexota bacterium]
MPTRELVLDRPLDLRRTLSIHQRGSGDPMMQIGPGRVIRATRTADGPATIEIIQHGDRIAVETWGPGADCLLAAVPALVGLDDDRSGFDPTHHPLVADLDRHHPGIRIGRTGAVLEALIPAILEQKVTGTEAWRGLRGLIRQWGEPAPGPFGLRLLPEPAAIAAIPYHAFHPLGIERRRADLVRRVADRANRFEEIVDLSRDAAWARLTALPGIGPWTAAEVALRALGDPDAVSVGDFHLPNLVAFTLAGEIRGNDVRMVELLEPWRGHRARVIRLLEASRLRPPAFGPRYAPRSIATI